MLYGILYVILLGWLSWEDIKHLRIHVIGLAGLGSISLLEIFLLMNSIWIPILIAISMYAGLWILNYMAAYLTKSPAMGQGDILLMSILASSLSPEHIPCFVVLIGILSWMWGTYWTRGQRNQRFPMVPPIGVAFMVMRIFL